MRPSLARAIVPANAARELREVAKAHNEAVTATETRFRRIPDSEYVDVETTTADVPFVVMHNLGRVPTMFHAQMEQAGNCYATSDDRNEWTGQLIKVRCNVANSRLRIKVEAL
jgi:hypothetical protein